MCGIAGFVWAGALPDAERGIKAMTDVVRHRGPDGEGSFVQRLQRFDYTVALGHRRLAIIDLATGDQPMTDETGQATLVFNGEIYNFHELREELAAFGHRFRTKSDTEVLLQSYLRWGPECVQHFRGMFAFALWDRRWRRLLLARDHFGKKPLYFYQDQQKLLFASEIKAILAATGERSLLDHGSVADYLLYRYVPAPHTLFANVRKIMPGSYAIWEDGSWQERRFYIPPYGTEPPRRRDTLGDPLQAFATTLEDAVRVRMVSDVPYGAFLSGGLDSSAIVALMSRHSEHPINTFSVGFREAKYSELRYARLVAQHFNTNHTELVISADDLMQFLPLLIYHSDAPVSEASNIPIYLMSREAAKSVKMVLTGEGSDELLGGYPKHSAERFVSSYQKLVPEFLHRGLVEPAMRALPGGFRRLKIMSIAMGLRARRDRMPGWLNAMSRTDRDRFLQRPPERAVVHTYPFSASHRRSALERALYFDQTSWLPDNLLERGDRMTMAASIEARMPFMDINLAQLLGELRDKWRVRGFTQKYILRRMMLGILPRPIISRPKVGFRVPIGEWFRGPMRSFVRDHVCSADSLSQALFDRSEMQRVLNEHESGRQNHEKLIWMLVNLELFCQRFELTAVASPHTTFADYSTAWGDELHFA